MSCTFLHDIYHLFYRIRETFSETRRIDVIKRRKRRKMVEITISEQDYDQLLQQARSTAWIEQKIAELQRIGDRLWHQLNQKEILKVATQRAEKAEIRCRSLEHQLFQAEIDYRQTGYDLEDGSEREIDYPDLDDREV